MKKNIFFAALLLTIASALAITACSDDDKDMTYPTIADGDSFNPINCQVYHLGDTIPFRAVFGDNQELGNFNIEIHNNFDHHSHSTEADDHEGEECEDHDHEGEEHTLVNPWIFNQSYNIPAGLTQYRASVDIAIPKDIDAGDYHFMVRLTDHAGCQQLKAVSIIIEE